MVLGNKSKEKEGLNFENFSLNNIKEEKILGITIDSKLNFDSHLKSICKKANQKVGALSRVSYLMNKKQ